MQLHIARGKYVVKYWGEKIVFRTKANTHTQKKKQPKNPLQILVKILVNSLLFPKRTLTIKTKFRSKEFLRWEAGNF